NDSSGWAGKRYSPSRRGIGNPRTKNWSRNGSFSALYAARLDDTESGGEAKARGESQRRKPEAKARGESQRRKPYLTTRRSLVTRLRANHGPGRRPGLKHSVSPSSVACWDL